MTAFCSPPSTGFHTTLDLVFLTTNSTLGELLTADSSTRLPLHVPFICFYFNGGAGMEYMEGQEMITRIGGRIQGRRVWDMYG